LLRPGSRLASGWPATGKKLVATISEDSTSAIGAIHPSRPSSCWMCDAFLAIPADLRFLLRLQPETRAMEKEE
jgi:hypothetical protein